jgi:hypothetical protein
MHTDQMRSAEAQLEVLVEQMRLLKAHGEALTALVDDAKSKKWPSRLVLATSIIAALASIAALAYSAGIL